MLFLAVVFCSAQLLHVSRSLTTCSDLMVKEAVAWYNNKSSFKNWMDCTECLTTKKKHLTGDGVIEMVKFKIRETDCKKTEHNLQDCQFKNESKALTGICSTTAMNSEKEVMEYVSCVLNNKKKRTANKIHRKKRESRFPRHRYKRPGQYSLLSRQKPKAYRRRRHLHKKNKNTERKLSKLQSEG